MGCLPRLRHLRDYLTDVSAQELGRRLGHLAERAEHRLGLTCFRLGLEQPKGVLNSVPSGVYFASPISGLSGHATDQRRPVLARHRSGFLLVARPDTDAPDKRKHSDLPWSAPATSDEPDSPTARQDLSRRRTAFWKARP